MKLYVKLLFIILGLPKSIWINFKCLPIRQAMCLPILVSHKMKIASTSGKITINGKIHMGMITFGLSGYGLAIYDPCVLQNNGLIVFNGKTRLGGGIRICCNTKGRLEFGRNNVFTGLCSIICSENIQFGDDCLVSWDTQFMDTDLHDLLEENRVCNPNQPITVGEHVWICSRVCVLKGSAISAGSTVGCGTIVTHSFEERNCLIVGNPPKVYRRNSYWLK